MAGRRTAPGGLERRGWTRPWCARAGWPRCTARTVQWWMPRAWQGAAADAGTASHAWSAPEWASKLRLLAGWGFQATSVSLSKLWGRGGGAQAHGNVSRKWTFTPRAPQGSRGCAR